MGTQLQSVYTVLAAPFQCSHTHTHQSSSRAWQGTSKGYLRRQTLEAVEELGLVTQLLGSEAFPCYLQLQTGCEGRVLAWFLLLWSKHYPGAERVLYH